MERTQLLDRDERVCRAEVSARPSVRTTVLERVTPILASRYLPLLLACGAVIASLPAVGTGLLTDDYMHHALLAGDSPNLQQLADAGLAPSGSGSLRAALANLFVVADPDENLERFRNYGALPWWTADDYRVAHWRPVASLTHWLDYRLFPDSVRLMHVHSILWFAAVMTMVTYLYRRFIPAAWIAGLAAVLYLLSDDSYFPTMWLANRNLLISLCFGIGTLILHDRWRRNRSKAAAVAAPLCLLVSVLATEGGVATWAYLFAYEVTLGTGRWTRRLVALAPSVVVIVLWRLVYNLQGYGASGGGFYVDPVREPLGFLAAVVGRIPFLLGCQWTASAPELYGLLAPQVRIWLWAGWAVVLVAIPVLLWPLLRTNRRLRFWLIGMYAAALPVCATIPMGRALLFVAIGAFALVGELLGLWLRGGAVERSNGAARWLRMTIIALLLAHVPLAMGARVLSPITAAKVDKHLKRTLATRLFVRLESDRDLVVVNAPNPASCVHDPFWAVYNGKGLPGAIRTLAPGYGPLELARTGPRRLVVRSLGGSLFTCPPGLRLNPVLFYRHLSDMRRPEQPMKAGDRIALPRMTVDILAVGEDGLPSEVAFLFGTPLDAREWRWIFWNWNRGRFEAFRPPPVGQSMCVAGSV